MLDCLDTSAFRSDLLGLDVHVLLTVTLATSTDFLVTTITVVPPANECADVHTFGKVTLKGWVSCSGVTGASNSCHHHHLLVLLLLHHHHLLILHHHGLLLFWRHVRHLLHAWLLLHHHSRLLLHHHSRLLLHHTRLHLHHGLHTQRHDWLLLHLAHLHLHRGTLNWLHILPCSLLLHICHMSIQISYIY